MTREPADDAQTALEIQRRVFFAFWPDAELRAAFVHATHKAARACGGRPVPAQSLHVTLLFLGVVAESRISDVVTIGNRAAAAVLLPDMPLYLIFDRIEFWEKARVLAATTTSDAASGLAVATTLAENLSRETCRAGFAPDLKLFRAHVTVARKVARLTHSLRMHEVRWPVTHFALVESRTLPEGPLYSVINSWPLDMRQNSVNSSKSRAR